MGGLKDYPTTRVVETGKATLGLIINKRPGVVYWITVCSKNTTSLAKLQIYNGMGTGPNSAFITQNRGAKHYLFTPPIRCPIGIFVQSDSNVEVYTICHEPIGQAPFEE